MKKDDMRKIIDRFPGIPVGVLGDVMLDQYVWGNATRISQEAPVPVVFVHRRNHVPGGAANVARNIVSLNGKAVLFGVAGLDLEGNYLCESLASAGADIGGLLRVAERPTTVKTRVLAGNQQVVRIDQEDTSEISLKIRRWLKETLEQRMAEGCFKALILEDYAKGVMGRHFMQAVVDMANKYGIMTTLDPHPNNNFMVKGLYLMTPNRQEAFSLAGIRYVPGIGNPLQDKPLLQVARKLMRTWAPRYLLVTLGGEGMALFDREGGDPLHIPTRARQVFDVSGAGDTVMGTMVMALLAGAEPYLAARIANAAAGVVVGMVGTAAIERQVLLASLE